MTNHFIAPGKWSIQRKMQMIVVLVGNWMGCRNALWLTFWWEWEIEQHNRCRANPHAPCPRRWKNGHGVRMRIRWHTDRAERECETSAQYTTIIISIIIINWCCHFQWHLIVGRSMARRYCARVYLFHLHSFASLFFESHAVVVVEWLLCRVLQPHEYNHSRPKQICALNERASAAWPVDTRLSERWQHTNEWMNENILSHHKQQRTMRLWSTKGVNSEYIWRDRGRKKRKTTTKLSLNCLRRTAALCGSNYAIRRLGDDGIWQKHYRDTSHSVGRASILHQLCAR